eukprot:scpid88035/ scgid3693/ 
MRVWAWRQRSESSRRYSRVYTTSMQPGEKPVSVRSRLCTAYSRHILLSNTVDHGRWTTMTSPAAVMRVEKILAMRIRISLQTDFKLHFHGPLMKSDGVSFSSCCLHNFEL